MKIVYSNTAQQSFIYSFAIDGGAVGSLDSKIKLPATGNIISITAKVTQVFVGAGASLSIGFFGALGALVTAGALPGAVGDFIFVPALGAFQTTNVLFTINAVPLTAGRMIVNILYSNSANR